MKNTLSFGLSILLGISYLIFYKSLTPLLDLILFIFIVILIVFSYSQAVDTDNHYIKLGLLILIVGIILIPTLFLSFETNIFSQIVWTAITFILFKKKITKEIKEINKN